MSPESLSEQLDRFMRHISQPGAEWEPYRFPHVLTPDPDYNSQIDTVPEMFFVGYMSELPTDTINAARQSLDSYLAEHPETERSDWAKYKFLELISSPSRKLPASIPYHERPPITPITAIINGQECELKHGPIMDDVSNRKPEQPEG